jgi:hypothetical protein
MFPRPAFGSPHHDCPTDFEIIMQRISRKNFTLIFMMIAAAFLVLPGATKDDVMLTKLWPVESKSAAGKMIELYGRPDVESGSFLVWNNREPWARITVSRAGVLHRFPFEHFDEVEHTLSYRVPEDKVDDLIMFDGSLLIDRTRGTISARCDDQSSNVLALNLAHDIVTGKRSVQDARLSYALTVRDKLNGADPVSMKRLSFTADLHTSDPDVNITGLAGPRSSKIKKKWFSRFIAGID